MTSAVPKNHQAQRATSSTTAGLLLDWSDPTLQSHLQHLKKIADKNAFYHSESDRKSAKEAQITLDFYVEQATYLIIHALMQDHFFESETIAVLTAVIEGGIRKKDEYEKILRALKPLGYDDADKVSNIISTVAKFNHSPLRKWSTMHAAIDAVYVAGSIFGYLDEYMPDKDSMTTVPGMAMAIIMAIIAVICAKMAITGLPAAWEAWLLRQKCHRLYAIYQYLKTNHLLIRRGISGIKNAVHAIYVVTQNILPVFLHHFSFAFMTSLFSIVLGISLGFIYALISIVYDKWHEECVDQMHRNHVIRSKIKRFDDAKPEEGAFLEKHLYFRQQDCGWLKFARLICAGFDGFFDGLYVFNCGHQDSSIILRLIQGISISAAVTVCSAFSLGAPLIALACVAIAWAGVCVYRNIQKERAATKANDDSVKKLNRAVYERLLDDYFCDKLSHFETDKIIDDVMRDRDGTLENQRWYAAKDEVQPRSSLSAQNIRDGIRGGINVVKNANTASSTGLKSTNISRDSHDLASAGLASAGFYGYVQWRRRREKEKIKQGVQAHYCDHGSHSERGKNKSGVR